ncbi:MAG: CocE/NonD family hydrolase [Desulfovibrionaceae bacterium]|nr:CocE/NonD family hydrolase [Desulfovibrionaceae bacterium]
MVKKQFCMQLSLCTLFFVYLLGAFTLAGAKPLAGMPPMQHGQPSAPSYTMLIERDVQIPLRDGTLASADIYRPHAEGRFPVLIEGTAYDKRCSTDIRMSTHSFFVPRGYVFIIWNIRGRFLSGGTFSMEQLHGNDGYDVVEWAARQAWSSGRIGLVGKSYSGQVLYHTAAAQPPHLVCAMPALTDTNAWRWYYKGGAMEYGFATYWASAILGWDMAEKNLTGAALQQWKNLQAQYLADPQAYATVLPAASFAPARIGQRSLIATWAAHPVADAYWQKLSPAHYFSSIRIPMLHIGGWFDIFQQGAFEGFAGMQQHGASALARHNQRLLIGPWHHSVPSYTRTRIGCVDYGTALRQPSLNDMRLAFADYWLKNTKTALFDENMPVRFFTMGRNVWQTSAAWPLPHAQEQRFYLHPKHSGTIASLNDGSLAASPQAAAAAQSYVAHPLEPLPTRGGAGLLLFAYGPDGLTEYGQQDQHPVEKKSLTFTSAPLEKDMEISGAVCAELYAASSAVDTDWVVRLSDVNPQGLSLNVTEGIQRARFRTSPEQPTLLTPYALYRYRIDMTNTSYVFKAGHRLRLTINSSSFPRWSRNLQVADFPEQASTWQRATNSIALDAAHPSCLLLPVIP